MTLHELDKFIDLIVTRGVLGQMGLPCSSLYNTSWGCPQCSVIPFPGTGSREIMKFLLFDIKSERRRRLVEKFFLASCLWNCFIESRQKPYVSNVYVTVDEQLLPCKARCRFIQNMANKPDKFGLKFSMMVDADSKYLYNDFPYLGKDDTRETSVSVPTDVVMKLMLPLFKHGYNVTCDNFFTSLDLVVRLAKEKCSLVGTIHQNRREQPQAAKAKQQLHETTLFKTTISSTSITLTCYHCKKAKSVIMLSALHPDVEVSSENNTKKKPETNNKTKVGVDVVD